MAIVNVEEMSRFGSKKGRKLTSLTSIQKKELCKYKRNNPSKSYKEICKKFGISKSTGEWPQMEEALAIWVNLANKTNHTLTSMILSQKAMQFARKLNISDFKSSNKSINSFHTESNRLLDVNVPKLNALNAINWTMQAWNNVTDDIIYCYWQRIGILPDEEMVKLENELEMRKMQFNYLSTK
ncbi:3377_t:CDS:2 [Ambispora leptoticha]|uniref:3377_t:CDS:1 n=1 Tax=Ambispora leptoticha TaxID=144679 RepID=A0A9N9FVY2_9GLOM|nr:3377_t:CDS:2 [Ambispora leptoticha]